jgi:hypothetical protein
VIPHFLGAGDHPWLRSLIDEFHRFAGRPRRELERRLRDPLPRRGPPGKGALAVYTLRRICGDQERAPLKPRRARSELFLAGARYPGQVDVAWATAANTLGSDVEALRASLFADLPGERRLVAPRPDLSPEELALRTNLSIAKALLYRASSVHVEVFGNSRVIVRHARLRGLICTVRRSSVEDECRIEISGPFALFRRTLVYGRSLGELVPLLAWCNRFRLSADCVIEENAAAFHLETGDPVFPSDEPRQFDSRMESRFAREFLKKAPEWDLVREPEPVEADGTLIFPDFALWRRDRPEWRWLLEIVGFWTPDYLRHKISRLRAARLSNLIVCIDTERNCVDEELPRSALVLRYRRKIDVEELLRILEATTWSTSID